MTLYKILCNLNLSENLWPILESYNFDKNEDYLGASHGSVNTQTFDNKDKTLQLIIAWCESHSKSTFEWVPVDNEGRVLDGYEGRPGRGIEDIAFIELCTMAKLPQVKNEGISFFEYIKQKNLIADDLIGRRKFTPGVISSESGELIGTSVVEFKNKANKIWICDSQPARGGDLNSTSLYVAEIRNNKIKIITDVTYGISFIDEDITAIRSTLYGQIEVHFNNYDGEYVKKSETLYKGYQCHCLDGVLSTLTGWRRYSEQDFPDPRNRIRPSKSEDNDSE